MSNLQQIKQIVHAKWTQSNGNNSASATQEELTAEAERLLKKSQSKSFKNVSQVWQKLIFKIIFREQSVWTDYRLCEQDDCQVQQLSGRRSPR